MDQESTNGSLGLDCREVSFTGHAFQRMFERSVSPEEVRQVIDGGEVIQEYPDDRPFPSCLILGWVEGRALHAVVARDPDSGRCFVVTAYPPDPGLWDSEFRTRRTS